MSWKDVIKMPPIQNPRKDKKYPNDNLSMEEYEELFEDVVDPEIEKMAKDMDRTVAYVTLNELGMSKDKAAEIANKLYAKKGYGKIYASGNKLIFNLERN
jgi:hypothetical protein